MALTEKHIKGRLFNKEALAQYVDMLLKRLPMTVRKIQSNFSTDQVSSTFTSIDNNMIKIFTNLDGYMKFKFCLIDTSDLVNQLIQKLESLYNNVKGKTLTVVEETDNENKMSGYTVQIMEGTNIVEFTDAVEHEEKIKLYLKYLNMCYKLANPDVKNPYKLTRSEVYAYIDLYNQYVTSLVKICINLFIGKFSTLMAIIWLSRILKNPSIVFSLLGIEGDGFKYQDPEEKYLIYTSPWDELVNSFNISYLQIPTDIFGHETATSNLLATNLVEVNFPETIALIRENAFSSCTSLQRANIPYNLVLATIEAKEGETPAAPNAFDETQVNDFYTRLADYVTAEQQNKLN